MTTTQAPSRIEEDEFTHARQVPIRMKSDEIWDSMHTYEYVRVRTAPGSFAYEGICVMLDKLLAELQDVENNSTLTLEDVLGPRTDPIGINLDSDGNPSASALTATAVEPEPVDDTADSSVSA